MVVLIFGNNKIKNYIWDSKIIVKIPWKGLWSSYWYQNVEKLLDVQENKVCIFILDIIKFLSYYIYWESIKLYSRWKIKLVIGILPQYKKIYYELNYISENLNKGDIKIRELNDQHKNKYKVYILLLNY